MRFSFLKGLCLSMLFVLAASIAATGQETRLERADRLYSEATNLISTQQYQSLLTALANYREARAIYADLGETEKEGKALVGVGFVSHSFSNHDDAIRAYLSAIPLFESVRNIYWGARSLNNLGRVYDDTGQVSKALETFKRALVLRREARDANGEAVTLNSIGAAHIKLGNFSEGLDYYQNALAVRNGVEIENDRYNVVGKAIILNNIGRAFDELGDDKKALKYLKLALERRLEAKDRRGEATTLNNLGLVETDLGNFDSAIQYYEKSLKILAELGIQYNEAEVLNNLGVVLMFQRRTEEAESKLKEALSYYEKIDDLGGQSTTLNNLVTNARIAGKPGSEKQMNDALIFSRRASERGLEARTLNNLMVYWLERKNLRVAAFYGKQSVNIYQEIRSKLGQFDESVRRGYLASVTDTYRNLADILIGLGQYSQAKQVLRMLKAEEYYEFVQRSSKEIEELDAKVSLTDAEKRLIERYKSIAESVSSLSREYAELDEKKRRQSRLGIPLSNEEDARFKELSGLIADANGAFRLFIEKQLIDELGESRVRDIEFDRSLQSKLKKWGGDTVAIYTVVTNDRYRVILTTPFTQVSGKTEIAVTEFNKKVFEFREALQDIRKDPRPKAKELYDIILKPIEKQLRDSKAKTIVWSLDGTLRYVPIAALSPDGKKYLVEDYQNAIITAETRDDLEVGTNDWRALGMGISKETSIVNPGNPEEVIEFEALPGSLAEINSIIRDTENSEDDGLLRGRELIDDAFTRESFEKLLGAQNESGRREFSVLHFASHFRLGSNWRDSFLVIGNSDYLTLEQISNSPTYDFGDIELVTLSACDTASTGDSNGREIDSLASAIQIKSGKAVMATLWAVADQSTPQFMTEFYKDRSEKRDTTKIQSLRKVQRDFLNGKAKPDPEFAKRLATIFPSPESRKADDFVFDPEKPFAHPYFWSPFVIIGNWR